LTDRQQLSHEDNTPQQQLAYSVATLHCLQNSGWPKKSTLSIFLLNIDQFSLFFTSRLCKKFATHWHAHHTYCVTTLHCKTNIRNATISHSRWL